MVAIEEPGDRLYILRLNEVMRGLRTEVGVNGVKRSPTARRTTVFSIFSREIQ